MFNYRNYNPGLLIIGIFITACIDSFLFLSLSADNERLFTVDTLNNIIGFSTSIYLTIIFTLPLIILFSGLESKKSIFEDIHSLLFGFFIITSLCFFLFPVFYFSAITSTFASLIFQKLIFISIISASLIFTIFDNYESKIKNKNFAKLISIVISFFSISIFIQLAYMFSPSVFYYLLNI